MPTIIVKDSTGLVAALNSAKSGDVIKLAAGDYTSFSVKGLTFGGAGVTVTSLDTANPATLHGFQVRGCEGLTFSGLEMATDASRTYAYQIFQSKNVTLDNVDMHGSLDGDCQNDVSGLMIRDSDGVTVTNSEFHQLAAGISNLNSKNILIDGNKFHEIQFDGVRGGGTSHITVSNNYFTNFDPEELDHPDAIQFWTTNTTESATDITVTGNVILRGDGAPVQGVFFRDQVGNLPFKNVEISGNLVIGGMVNGIKVNGGQGVSISDNVVAGLADQRSAIGVQDSSQVSVTNNSATHFVLESSVAGLVDAGNTVIETPIDGGESLLRAFFVDVDDPRLVAEFSSYVAATTDAVSTMLATRQEVVTVSGTEAADKLSVDEKRDTLVEAGGGDDLITSSGVGHNTLVGGAGDDTYRVNSVEATVVELAGGGVDMVVASVDYELADNVENLRLVGEAREGFGNNLDNRMTGTSGDDLLDGMGGDDVLYGGDGADYLSGGAGRDNIYGGNGDDVMLGGDGDDFLRSEAGNDSVSGGAGADTILAGEGADSLSGGAGADTFRFGDGDIVKGEVIFDFNAAEGDKINLQSIDANTRVGGNQTFDFIGTAGFSKKAGELRYEVSGSDAYLTGDVNGDGVADFQLLVKGITTFSSGDFVL